MQAKFKSNRIVQVKNKRQLTKKKYDLLWFCDFESSGWAELHQKSQIQSRRTDLIFAMIAKRHNTYCVIISMNVHNNAKVTLEFDRLNITFFKALKI